ncbi:MAG: decaprenyl-phosphate phosphoribosyltransferase [Anaerolineae bacterium]|nr:decaprenyl-phosphate phosphoribosyltransferase [Anaerolineae bacterium]
MLAALIKTLRPKQWLKNGFLFVGLFFDRQILDLAAVVRVGLGAVLFSLLASAVYILNDLNDLEADRNHPKKSRRPLASGDLPTGFARGAVVVLLLVVFPLAYALSTTFFWFLAAYFALNLAYTLWFKHLPLIDVLILASFYVIRVAAGVSLIHVERFSPWLYLFTIFLALYLGMGKRRAELVMLAEDANSHRRVLDGYSISFLDQLITIVLTLAILTYSLYTFSAPNLPSNNVMMLTIPFVIYGIFRYLYLVHIEDSGDAPEEILVSDRPLQLSIALWGVSIMAIFSLFPPGS